MRGNEDENMDILWMKMSLHSTCCMQTGSDVDLVDLEGHKVGGAFGNDKLVSRMQSINLFKGRYSA
jgi:hypothetical protein